MKHRDNKRERKREQKMHERTIESKGTSVIKTINKETGAGADQKNGIEEEEAEDETSANTGKTYKRIRTTEFSNFETTSMSNHEETDGDNASSQDFGVNLTGATMSNTTSCSANEFIPVGERLAALYNGTIMSRETQNGRGGSKGLRFKCANMHEFTISFSKLNRVPQGNLEPETCKDIWCVKCHNFFYRCIKKASDNGAEVTSKLFDKGYVNFNCRMNHDFKISIHRNPDKIWCQHCKKDVRNESKKQIEVENEKKRQKEYEHQKMLFEESRKHMQSEKIQQNSDTKFSIQDILVQVELKAKYDTQMFLNTSKVDMPEALIFQVYKTIYMPSEILQASFQSLGESLNSCFRKMAILVHPDKNSHPLANQAFQKLSQAYVVCQETR